MLARRSTGTVKDDTESNMFSKLEGFISQIGKKYDEELINLKQFMIDQRNNEILELKMSLQEVIHNEITQSINDIAKLVVKDIIEQELSKLHEMVKEEINILKKELMTSNKLVIRSSNIEKSNNNNNNNNANNTVEIMSSQKIQQCQQPMDKSNECIVIMPKNKQSSEETVKSIKRNINVGNLGIGINKIRNGSNGKVIVELDKEIDKSVLANEITEKMGNSVKVTTITKKLPKLKVIAINKDIIETNDKVLTDNIVKQNKLINLQGGNEIKIIKKYLKNQDSGTMILELHPDIHKLLLKNGRIKIGWMSYKIYNFIDINRCFNC
ncbi:uncharacterized protein LOC141536265 isoform X1 [Cotesia typhae]|uniref:uncharacterized protein LOC141536265 isoform X1 n=1 Tax=Cotesia typhae TaxID=2053667 RepID=UPI003D69D24D